MIIEAVGEEGLALAILMRSLTQAWPKSARMYHYIYFNITAGTARILL